jgi:hypothetical protein
MFLSRLGKRPLDHSALSDGETYDTVVITSLWGDETLPVVFQGVPYRFLFFLANLKHFHSDSLGKSYSIPINTFMETFYECGVSTAHKYIDLWAFLFHLSGYRGRGMSLPVIANMKNDTAIRCC